jgi:hypothetical protein
VQMRPGLRNQVHILPPPTGPIFAGMFL